MRKPDWAQSHWMPVICNDLVAVSIQQFEHVPRDIHREAILRGTIRHFTDPVFEKDAQTQLKPTTARSERNSVPRSAAAGISVTFPG